MDLKELLGEELYSQVSEKVGEDHRIAVVSDGSYIPKEKFNEKNDELKELKNELKDRDTQLEELSGKAQGNDDLKKEIETLKEQNKTKADELQKKLDKQTFDFNLEKALMTAKARNPKAVKALLDADAIKLDNEKLWGLDEQLTNIKESDPYLFDDQEPEPKTPSHYSPGPNKKSNNPKEPDAYQAGVAAYEALKQKGRIKTQRKEEE